MVQPESEVDFIGKYTTPVGLSVSDDDVLLFDSLCLQNDDDDDDNNNNNNNNQISIAPCGRNFRGAGMLGILYAAILLPSLSCTIIL